MLGAKERGDQHRGREFKRDLSLDSRCIRALPPPTVVAHPPAHDARANEMSRTG